MNDPVGRPLDNRAAVDPKLPLVIGVLLGTVIGSIFVWVYLLYEVRRLRDDLDRANSEIVLTKRRMMDEIAKTRETSASSHTKDGIVESLKAELEQAREQERLAAGRAKAEFTRRAEVIAARLEKIDQERAETANAVSKAVSQVRDVQTETEATKARVGEVSTEIGTVKTELSSTKSELEKTVAELRSTRGDLGIQSGLIATNARELAALKALGDRVITDLNLPKEKAPRKLDRLQIRLKGTNPKRNLYTVEVTVDDRLIEKKDKTLNEPVQFILAGASQPYELVVNAISKDMISGYISAPKQLPRSN